MSNYLRQSAIVAFCLMTVFLNGCSSELSKSESIFTEDGLPAKCYLDGGGFIIKYVAPSEGTAYWVEETTQKIIETRALKMGEEANFGGEDMDPEEVKNILGVEFKDAKFTLYFVPSTSETND